MVEMVPVAVAAAQAVNVFVMTAGPKPSLLTPSRSSEISGWFVCQGGPPVFSARVDGPNVTVPWTVPWFVPIESWPLPLICHELTRFGTAGSCQFIVDWICDAVRATDQRRTSSSLPLHTSDGSPAWSSPLPIRRPPPPLNGAPAPAAVPTSTPFTNR